MLSDETINKLTDLFEEDQKKALEFKQGNRNMTIQKQLSYYFGDKNPITNNEEKFLDGFALNIQRNIGLICKISNLKEFAEKLANKKGFTKVTLGITDSALKSNKRSLNNNEGIKEFLKHGGSYTGTTERSDDWSGVKGIYDLEIKKNLKTDLKVLIKTATQDYEQQGKITIKDSNESIPTHLLTSESDSEIDKQITERTAEVRELPAWNNLVTSGDFTKARNSDKASKEGVEASTTNSNALNTSLTFSDSENINRTLEADLHDLRSMFWNSFYHLFDNRLCL